jgi:hypothetical protein
MMFAVAAAAHGKLGFEVRTKGRTQHREADQRQLQYGEEASQAMILTYSGKFNNAWRSRL